MQICDMIRQGDTQAKYAVGAIKKKVNDKNPHVALYALEVMESVVKNCGQTVHDEVANKQTMEELKELFKRQVEVNVRNKILYLIQAWAHAFRNEPKYKVVQDTYQIMKVEGHVFPEFKESDAMFAAERAPDWVDAEECHRCRVQFGVVTRKVGAALCFLSLWGPAGDELQEPGLGGGRALPAPYAMGGGTALAWGRCPGASCQG
nr:hepatocyte growth factor-regulated tyrosine kinase substrate [Pelodiscus sinensis]|eukprot:XP_006110490.2 hepatocyte growth factor-regulated tyrosine kinase substrate [Pelodiscus sinensis]